MPYDECWSLQKSLFEKEVQTHLSHNDSDCAGTILFVEHTPVYTIGKSGNEANMLVSEAYLRELGASYYHIDRGGDVTFHGPGQIVCYPILDISRIGIGLRRYIELLEQSVIDTVAKYGIAGERVEGATGVWLKNPDGTAQRKICAIGVRSSHFITMHGLALNVNTDLSWFEKINPCGFKDKAVTSMQKEKGEPVEKGEVIKLLEESLLRLLNLERA